MEKVGKARAPQQKSSGRSEDGEQIELFRRVHLCIAFGYKVAIDPRASQVRGWAAANAAPCGHRGELLRFLFAIPNGGARDIRTASLLKATGVKRGVSDMFLPVPMHGKHGLWLELKREDGGVESKEQKQWGADMRQLGYGYCLCHGADEAWQILTQYLQLDQD